MEGSNRSLLSNRERKIMESAAVGLTDQQIAAQTGLSVTTVNSYWVRIRGKLGRRTRTELVSRWLQQESENTIATCHQRIAELERQIAQLRAGPGNGDPYDIIETAFALNPEALVVLDAYGKVLAANERAENLFGLSQEDLLKADVQILFPADSEDGTNAFAALEPGDGVIYFLSCSASNRKKGKTAVSIKVRTAINPSDGRAILICVIRQRVERAENKAAVTIRSSARKH